MILNGKPVAEEIQKKLAERAADFAKTGAKPKLEILRVGCNPEDVAYERRVVSNCEKSGMKAVCTEIAEGDSASLIGRIETCNRDPETRGVLVFRPLPAGMDEKEIGSRLAWEKDIDCMNPLNLQKLFTGEDDAIPPCTPEAVVRLLKYYKIPLIGKHAVIVNRSLVLGKPLAQLLLAENATVTVCHSKTEDLAAITRSADIVVTGVGRPRHFGPEYFCKGSVVIDVGINFDESGKMCGDVDFEAVAESVSAITPVPGGIGAVTSMVLLDHALREEPVS